jgi:hypothetical protein
VWADIKALRRSDMACWYRRDRFLRKSFSYCRSAKFWGLGGLKGSEGCMYEIDIVGYFKNLNLNYSSNSLAGKELSV